MTVVHCDGLVFETHPRDRNRAYLIDPEGFDSWLGGADINRQDDPRANAHGSFWAPGWLSSKVTPITGTILAPSQSEFEVMKRRLEAFLVGKTRRMSVQDDDGLITWGDVGLAQQALVTPRGGRSYAGRFQVQVWSEDPYRYGDRHTFGPGVAMTLFHRGTVDATPEFTVSGNMPGGYEIRGPGSLRYVVAAGPSAGQTDVIDFGTGWLTRNGTPVDDGVVSRAETWSIPDGAQWAHSLATSGTGQMTGRLYDTYA